MEEGGSTAVPQELAGAAGSTTAPEVPTREASPYAWEPGAGSKQPVPMRRSRGLGVHPPNVSVTQQRRCKSPIPLFFSIFTVTHAFLSHSILRRRNLLALAPKKSIALQVRRQPSANVAPVSGGSGAGATASLADEAPLTVALSNPSRYFRWNLVCLYCL